MSPIHIKQPVLIDLTVCLHILTRHLFVYISEHVNCISIQIRLLANTLPQAKDIVSWEILTYPYIDVLTKPVWLNSWKFISWMIIYLEFIKENKLVVIIVRRNFQLKNFYKFIKRNIVTNNYSTILQVCLWAQSFNLLKADLPQDINVGFAFSRCLNGTFPWRRKCSVKALVR